MFYLLPFIPAKQWRRMVVQKSVKVNDFEVGYGQPVRIMGVINLSPESFYGGSVHAGIDSMLSALKGMEKDGADLIDIGAASTAPRETYGTHEVDVEEEIRRIREAMEHIRNATKLPISIDTTSARAAEYALDMGANMVNDTSGLQRDPSMARMVADRHVPVVIMGNCAEGCNGLIDVIHSLMTSMRIAKDAGIPRELCILDPGIGFGKPAELDEAILRSLGRFRALGQPILVGLSRKAFLGVILDEPKPDMRLVGTIAATAIAVANGADIIRAHDVVEARQAARVGETLRSPAIIRSGDTELHGVCDEQHASILLQQVGVGTEIEKALSEKAVVLNVLVHDISSPAALVIKQEMLALGGDAAYHHGTVDHEVEKTDLLVMGTPLQLRRLIRKLSKMNYFSLDKTGREIGEILKTRDADSR